MSQNKNKPSKKRKLKAHNKKESSELLKSKFINPTTKNQKEWNREIERLIRFENNYEGIKINPIKNPKRVTKSDIKELSALRGNKILENSTVFIPQNDDVRGLKRGEVNAKEYYNTIAGNRPLSSGGKFLKQHLKYDKRNEPFTSKNSMDNKPPFGSISSNEQIVLEFERAAKQFRPEFQDLIDKWSKKMISILGEEKFAELLDQNAKEFGQISRKEAYSKKALLEWETRFVERMPQGSEERKQGESLLNQLEQDKDVTTDYIERQQARWESRTTHRKNIDWNELKRNGV